MFGLKQANLLTHGIKLAIALASLAPFTVAGPLYARQDDYAGKLSFLEKDQPLTFQYSTDAPNETNWIALWHAGEGPVNNESPDGPAVLWEYAPDNDGSILLAVEDLLPGDYTAYFLAQDEYDDLADPVNVTFGGLPAELYFPVEEVTLHNARQAEPYVASVGGLALGRGNAKTVEFEKMSGDDWIFIDTDGNITGTPGNDCHGNAQAEIAAIADNGSKAVLKVYIPVHGEQDMLVEILSVMSYNLWAGGTNVKRYHEKQLRFILESDVDVIGFQESAEGEHAVRLGQALGWDYWQSNYSVGIISRYPVEEDYGPVKASEVPVANRTGSAGGGVRINLNGNAADQVELEFWSAHLHYTPYGPYDFCFDGNTTEEVLENEAYSGREGQMKAMVERITPQIDASNAANLVVLVGDMNAPSHLDWVESLREKNCGIADFPWPTSILPTEAGLIDSFRVAHPDPAAEEGTTWSPLYPFNEGATGRPEPQDRIDFVYGSKALSVESSEVLMVGEPKPVPDVRNNEWTSDHKAVLTRYRLTI